MTTVVLGFAIAGIAVLWLLTVPSLTIEDLTHHDIVPTSVEYVTDAEYARKSRLNEIVIHTNTLDYILRGTIYADHYTNERLLHRIVPGESLTVWGRERFRPFAYRPWPSQQPYHPRCNDRYGRARQEPHVGDDRSGPLHRHRVQRISLFSGEDTLIVLPMLTPSITSPLR